MYFAKVDRLKKQIILSGVTTNFFHCNAQKPRKQNNPKTLNTTYLCSLDEFLVTTHFFLQYQSKPEFFRSAISKYIDCLRINLGIKFQFSLYFRLKIYYTYCKFILLYQVSFMITTVAGLEVFGSDRIETKLCSEIKFGSEQVGTNFERNSKIFGIDQNFGIPKISGVKSLISGKYQNLIFIPQKQFFLIIDFFFSFFFFFFFFISVRQNFLERLKLAAGKSKHSISKIFPLSNVRITQLNLYNVHKFSVFRRKQQKNCRLLI
eukprot:TRINITY_DN29937_c0_g1_i2.p1 TRINITY_DN29937_c0_g1~~TRINITY_DN29937_c0_g1_i2.p1  ORF type:complete len:263 (+),score=-6.54 TRINITY_DN29937_c0_g1_i2:384-1172(+)